MFQFVVNYRLQNKHTHDVSSSKTLGVIKTTGQGKTTIYTKEQMRDGHTMLTGVALRCDLSTLRRAALRCAVLCEIGDGDQRCVSGMTGSRCMSVLFASGKQMRVPPSSPLFDS